MTSRAGESCESRALAMLAVIEERSRQGDRDLRTGYRAEAVEAYRSSRRLLHVAAGTVRGCLRVGRVKAPRRVLQALATATDTFGMLEQHLEGVHPL